MKCIIASIASYTIYPSYRSIPTRRGVEGSTFIFSTKNGVLKSFGPEVRHKSWNMRLDSDQEASTDHGISLTIIPSSTSVLNLNFETWKFKVNFIRSI